MLSHKVLTRQDVGDAAGYYEDGADDYYAQEGEASAWQGKGAEALGLTGAVDSKRFRFFQDFFETIPSNLPKIFKLGKNHLISYQNGAVVIILALRESEGHQ